MKVISSLVVFVLLFCPVNDIVGSEVIPDSSLGPTFYLDNSGVICANKNHEIIFYTSSDPVYWQGQQHFYLKVGEDPINITKKISKQLLKSGLYPCAYLVYKSPSVYVEKTSYYFDFVHQGLDNSGNVLVKFTHEVGKEKKQLHKVGVWNKDYGFKIIEFPENLNVQFNEHPFSPNYDYLFLQVYSTEKDQADWKAVIISLENGFWGELEKNK